MFAVPGWAVSGANLKTETVSSHSENGLTEPQRESRKRKRPHRVDVTADNVADLWQRVIERKSKNRARGKKQKTAKGPASTDDPDGTPAESRDGKSSGTKQEHHASQTVEDDEWGGFDDKSVGVQPVERKSKKKGKTSRAEDATSKSGEARDGEGPSLPSVTENPQISVKKMKKKKTDRMSEVPKIEGQVSVDKASSAPAINTSRPKLTPLQASMREKLVSARFRHLNETLYTRPSAEAMALFQDSPDMFAEYHEGFRRQVDVWPENPVDSYIAEVLARGRVRPPAPAGRSAHPQPQQQQQQQGGSVLPLPRTAGTCTVADVGCGDAALAAALAPLQRKLRIAVRSFDLQAPSALVTRADAAALPLADGEVDVALFCLALMGTNWVDMVEEAYRVLRWKGELWVAEIKSRFAAKGGGGGKRAVVEHSVGQRRKKGAGGKLDKAAEEAASAGKEAELAVEVDGVEDRRAETDVSAFVEVLRRRGFVLRGEPSEAVDLSNKMFVKMYFVKGASPVKGKGAGMVRGRPTLQKKMFIAGEDDDVDLAKETAVLKPCVYKLR